MSIGINFGIHEVALKARSARAQLLAQNIVNADTPGYKAKDLDFDAIFKGSAQGTLNKTHKHHVDSAPNNISIGTILYRTPNQPSLDGNTVDSDAEKAMFAENIQRFNATVNFIDSRIKSLKKAITGQ